MFDEETFIDLANVPCLCPWCIANGSAAAKYRAIFQVDCPDHASHQNVADDAATEELCRRTPGHQAIQYPHWANHCGDYCAFVDYVGWDGIKDLLPQITDDIAALFGTKMVTLMVDAFRDELTRDGNGEFRGYLFRCLQCGRLRFYVDNT